MKYILVLLETYKATLSSECCFLFRAFGKKHANKRALKFVKKINNEQDIFHYEILHIYTFKNRKEVLL